MIPLVKSEHAQGHIAKFSKEKSLFGCSEWHLTRMQNVRTGDRIAVAACQSGRNTGEIGNVRVCVRECVYLRGAYVIALRRVMRIRHTRVASNIL